MPKIVIKNDGSTNEPEFVAELDGEFLADSDCLYGVIESVRPYAEHHGLTEVTLKLKPEFI